MIREIQNMLRSKDKKELDLAENDFDRLMEIVEEDDLDLDRLQRHVKEAFDKLDDDIEELSREVDEVLSEKQPTGAK